MVAYLILLEGKSLQASASPAGKSDFVEGTKTISIIYVYFFHFHSFFLICFLHYCTSFQSNTVLAASQHNLFHVKVVLEFYFYVKSLAHSNFMILFFSNLHSSYKVASFGLERGIGTDYGELDQWSREEQCLSLVSTRE